MQINFHFTFKTSLARSSFSWTKLCVCCVAVSAVCDNNKCCTSCCRLLSGEHRVRDHSETLVTISLTSVKSEISDGLRVGVGGPERIWASAGGFSSTGSFNTWAQSLDFWFQVDVTLTADLMYQQHLFPVCPSCERIRPLWLCLL